MTLVFLIKLRLEERKAAKGIRNIRFRVAHCNELPSKVGRRSPERFTHSKRVKIAFGERGTNEMYLLCRR